MTEAPAAGKFIQMYPERWGYFQNGVLIADWRRTGKVYRCTLYFYLSSCPYRQVLVSTQEAARRVCVELAQQVVGDG
jgi:hypothetical protein